MSMSSWFNHNVIVLVLDYLYNCTIYRKILINASVESLPVKRNPGQNGSITILLKDGTDFLVFRENVE